MNMILDGTGKGFRATVNKDKRLFVDAIAVPQGDSAALEGMAFNINTGPIALTSASQSGLAYIKYTGEGQFAIKEIIVIIGATTGGSGDGTVEIIKNPLSGDVITNAVVMDNVVNRNFSSNTKFNADTFKGAEGDSLNTGSIFASTTRSLFGTVINFNAGLIVLEKSNSIGVSFTPPSGNTAQEVRVAFTAYEI